MRVDPRLTPRGLVADCLSYRRVRRIASAVLALAIPTGCIWLAPGAGADSENSLSNAVMQLRSASCGPLRLDPVVEQTARDVNRQTDLWLNQEGRAAPVNDPLPILTDLGYGGDSAALLQGAGYTDAEAIKLLLLQGYLDIPDCSYTDYGVSVLRNRTTDYFLAAVVLAA